MKKIFTLFACVAAMAAITSCDWFVLDNQEQWNASVSGKLVDSKTGEAVQQRPGDSFSITETGWDKETPQNWTLKSNGTYVNKLVWAGNYYMRTLNGNFVADDQNFTLAKGDNNNMDFKVTPYVRILDTKVTYDASAKLIKATCRVETDLAESVVNNIGNVRLCVYTDRFVSFNLNNCSNTASAIKYNVDPKSGETIELTIDATDPANSYEFRYNRAHYVRVAAIGAHYNRNAAGELVVSGNSNSSNKYNYSSVYKIDTDGSVTEITEW